MAHNHEMNLAWKVITGTSMSVFLTGKAGTGKTTFLRRLRELSPKRMVVLAPTGVAAINAHGQTIHSFFQLPFGPIVPDGEAVRRQTSHYKMSKEKKNIIRTMDLLVIDEISMVRCDLLDAIDTELRKYRDRSRPFGGVQLLLIGDLQQLAPVAKESEWRLLAPYYTTQYFYGSRALQQVPYVTVELTHIYRQQDEFFVNLLGKIRESQIDDSVTNALNARYVPGFVPADGEGWIRLTTHNRMADDYNEQRLLALPSVDRHFYASIEGTFPENNYPADKDLVLREGAQVMFIKNDPSGSHEYYNGKIGTITAFDDDCIKVWCAEDRKTIAVGTVTWDNAKYVLDEKTREIREQIEGTFEQYPLRLAWAITVHKSQGLTFDHAVVDINDSFAHGQVYVALSRCRTLEGMVLARPLALRSLIVDEEVNAFIDKELTEAKGVVERLPQMEYDYYLSLLNDMFSFTQLAYDFDHLVRVVDEHLYKHYPDYLSLLKETRPCVEAELSSVSSRFAVQYQQLMQRTTNFQNDEHLQERLHAASEYFFNKMKELFTAIIAQTDISIGNKQTAAVYENALEAFLLSFTVKLGLFARMISEEFSVTNYLSAKAKASLDEVVITKDGTLKQRMKDEVPKKEKKEKGKKEKKEKVDTKALTLEMYQQGKSIAEIATERNLTEGTIAGHLAHYVGEGKVELDSLVPAERQRTILEAERRAGDAANLGDVKALLPDDYTWSELRLVLPNFYQKKKEE